jgi:hypothetical protein
LRWRCATPGTDARLLRCLGECGIRAAAPLGDRSDEGSALVAVVGIMGLLAVAAGALLLLTSTEIASSGHHRDAQEMAFAAEAGLAVGIRELQEAPDWSDVLAGVRQAAFRDATVTPTLVDGTSVDLADLTAALQAESDALSNFGADNPRWRLFAYGPARNLAPAAASSTAYLVIWIADDAADADGNPEADTNAVLQVRADSVGPRFARRGVAAAVRRTDPAPAGLHVLTWRRVR